MKVEIYKGHRWNTPHPRGNAQADWRPAWYWRLRASNGKILADGGEAYIARTDAIHGALLVTGLRLPKRDKGVRSQMRSDFPMPRGGFADVYVDYGAGGMVTYAQWLVETELIELVEA